MIINEEDDNDRAYMEGKNEEDSRMELATDENGISILAFIGNRAKTTLKILGTVNKRKLIILINSGSTHSFLDYDTAKELNYQMQKTTSWMMTLANGRRIHYNVKCPNFAWQMQNYKFQVEFKISSLRGCDMNLGADWIWIHDHVTFSHKQGMVTIFHKGKEVAL